MSVDPSGAIQSLGHIISAASRLMTLMHRADSAVDPNEEIEHMQANLDSVRQEVAS